jgi:proline iminopeptidase
MEKVIDERIDTRTIETEGFQLQIRMEGMGTPAIVIGSSIYYSRTLSQHLREHLHLIFMDHRGFAASQGHAESPVTLDVLLDDVELVRQRLGLGHIIVIGHSGHGFMALEYAKKYPENVSHVVMISLGPDFSVKSHEATDQYWQDSVSPERKAALEENHRHFPDEHLAKLLPDKRFIKQYVRNGARIWYDFRFDSTSLWEGVNINMEIIDHVWGNIFRDIDITKGLSTFDRPVFLALGRYDFLVAPPCSWNPVRAQFQNLTVRVFEQSGHMPPYEEATLFDKELLLWLSQHTVTAGQL